MGIAPDEQRTQQDRNGERHVNKAEVRERRYTYHYQVCISAKAAMMDCRGEIAGSWQDVDFSDVKGVVAFWAEKLLDDSES